MHSTQKQRFRTMSTPEEVDTSTETISISQHSGSCDEVYDEEGSIFSIGNIVFTDKTLGVGAYGCVKLAKKFNQGHIPTRRPTVPKCFESGSFSDLELSRENCDSSFVAVKIYNKSVLKRIRNFKRSPPHTTNKMEIHTALENVEKEIALMKLMRHPNIVSLLQVIDSIESDTLYLVLEYHPLGEIMSFDPETRRFRHRHENTPGLTKDYFFREETAAKYFVDVLHGLAYLHRNCIVHRDLKPENILISKNGVAKISDFGVSHFFEEERSRLSKRSDLQSFNQDDLTITSVDYTEKMRPTVLTRYDTDTALEMDCMSNAGKLRSTEGTYSFWSPEMCTTIKNKEFSGYASDMWAAGVCLYIFCSGRLPFDEDSPSDLFNLITNADLPLNGLGFSRNLRDLLSGLLQKDPNKRSGVGDCLKHEFCKEARIKRIELLGECIHRSSDMNIIVNKEDERRAFSIARLAKDATTKMSKRILSTKELFARPKIAKTLSSISSKSSSMELARPQIHRYLSKLTERNSDLSNMSHNRDRALAEDDDISVQPTIQGCFIQ